MLLQALENETRMALPEYAGQGAEAERGSQGEREAGSQGSESESEADLEEDMDAALGDEALGSLAQACSFLPPIHPQSHQKSLSFSGILSDHAAETWQDMQSCCQR